MPVKAHQELENRLKEQPQETCVLIAARAAAYADTVIDFVSVFDAPLWHDPKEPDWLSSALAEQDNLLDSGPEWAFWRDWYQGFLVGEPLDWELQRRVVVKIKEEIWEAGPEAVAEAIERIREDIDGEGPFDRPGSVPEVEKKTLVQYVRKLLENPEFSELSATGAADAIEKVVTDYKREAPSNCLPEELAHLEALPALFRSIARNFKSMASMEEKKADLIAQITNLNDKVARLEAELKAAKEKTLNGRFKIKAIEAFGSTIGCPWFLGVLGLETCHFFGQSPSDITYENLRGYFSDLLNATPASEVEIRDLPETHDI